MSKIDRVQVVWLTIFFEDDPRLYFRFQSYDAKDKRMAGYGGHWERTLSAVSQKRRGVLAPLVDTVRERCTAITKSLDEHYAGEDVALIKVEMALRDDGSHELNIQRYYDTESEWPGELLIVERGGETLLNYREAIAQIYHDDMVEMMGLIQKAFSKIRLGGENDTAV